MDEFELDPQILDVLHDVLPPARSRAIHLRPPSAGKGAWTKDHVTEFLESHLLPVDDVILLQNGNGVRAPSDGLGVFANGRQLAEEITGSRTVRILGVQRFHPAIASVCSDLTSVIGRQVMANMYVTPPESAGSVPHEDSHDVLIAQLGGTKIWQTPTGVADEPDPVTETRCTPAVHIARAGDVLVFPRGTTHSARTGTDLSVHITYGVLNEGE
jgi:ribosomal protein L16 Arg81 hydroxylase